jgi:HD superfamily phosphohydrolase
MVYPGAMHSRFEHSLGVMQIATQMFDAIVAKCTPLLENQLHFNSNGIGKDRQLLRIAALLHDVGHSPFSHAGEALMPLNGATKKPYRHEDYSAAAVRFLMRDVIDDHKHAQNFDIKAEDVADFILGKPTVGRRLLWYELLSGQFDADRADYLLRDSYHLGVAYGRYDLKRLIATITLAMDGENVRPAIERSGLHAAEALILARYFMFTQVYFQHTRRVYDHHFGEIMKTLLSGQRQPGVLLQAQQFPPADSATAITEFLRWDDWKVLGEISAGKGGNHATNLIQRHHFVRVYETPEVPNEADLEIFENVKSALGSKIQFTDKATNSWYKISDRDVRIRYRDSDSSDVLSRHSEIVRNMRAINQFRLYVDHIDKQSANQTIQSLLHPPK